MKRPTISGVLVLAGLLMAGGCGPKKEETTDDTYAAETPAQEEAASAMATLQGREGSGLSGTVVFTESEGGVIIEAQVSGVEGAGEHGFHVHGVGDCSAEDFTSAGGHFNPVDMPHAGPASPERHAGDLGNITIGEDGSGALSLTTDMLTIADGPSSVVGKAVILHKGMDDLESQPTGAAGARLACGVVSGQGS